MRRQAHVEATLAPVSSDAMGSLENQILQTMDGMLLRDVRHQATARNVGRIHHSSSSSEDQSNADVKRYGYQQVYSDGYGDGYRTGNENLKSMTRTRAVRRRGRENAKEVSKSKLSLVLTRTGRSEDKGKAVERRLQTELKGTKNSQHYLPYDFQLPHYSPFDSDSSSDSSSLSTADDDIPPEPGEYERDIESKRYKEYEPQKEPSHPQYRFGVDHQQTPRQPQPQPPTQNKLSEQLEENETAFCRLTSPFSPEFQYPQPTATPPSLSPAELDDTSNRSHSTSSSYSDDGSQRPSSECNYGALVARSFSTTPISPITQPTSPEPDSHRSPTTAQSSDFEDSIFEYYFDADEEELNIGNIGADLSPHGPSNLADAGNMIFGDLRKNSVLAHRRRSMATTSSLTDYEADLSSRDRNKQKEAIKRIVSGRVKDDWKWAWPQENPDAGTPIIDHYLEDPEDHDWTEREEWTSNISESDLDEEEPTSVATTLNGSQTVGDEPSVEPSKDPFRFESPDGVGDRVYQLEEARKMRRWRRAQEEMRTNDGVRCFTERRDAWTGARHVRRPSTRQPQRLPSTTSIVPSRPPTPPAKDRPISTMTYMDAAREPLSNEEAAAFFDYMKTEVPIAKPILPPDTPMRKGINEKAYPTIYDKVVVQGQTPFCPINLSVVTKSCVEGWKRDGEWPTKQIEPEPPAGKWSPNGRPVRSGNGRDILSRGGGVPRSRGMRIPRAEMGAGASGAAGGFSANAMPIPKREDARENRYARDVLEEAAVATANSGRDDSADKESRGVLRRSLQKVFDVVHHKEKGPE